MVDRDYGCDCAPGDSFEWPCAGSRRGNPSLGSGPLCLLRCFSLMWEKTGSRDDVPLFQSRSIHSSLLPGQRNSSRYRVCALDDQGTTAGRTASSCRASQGRARVPVVLSVGHAERKVRRDTIRYHGWSEDQDFRKVTR